MNTKRIQELSRCIALPKSAFCASNKLQLLTQTLVATLTLATVLGLAVACSDDENQITKSNKLHIDPNDFRQDYVDLPHGFVVRVASKACEGDVSRLPDREGDVEVRITYSDPANSVTDDNVATFYRNETHVLAREKQIFHDSTYVELQTVELQMLNKPNGDGTSLGEEVYEYPQHFSLNTQASLELAGSLHASQAPAPTQQMGKSKGKGKGVGQYGTQQGVAQAHQTPHQTQGVVVQQGKTKAFSTPVQQSPMQQGEPKFKGGVSQGYGNPAQTQTKGGIQQHKGTFAKGGKATPVSQMGGVAQGTPSQYQVPYAQGLTRNDVSCETMRSLNHDHFSQTFRPAYVSSHLTPYSWGYYQSPISWQSDEHTYYYYKKPTCAGASWCSE